ncbi:MAG: hypothetical protein A2Z52_00540 [Candidatus Moranbacteria bacterium RBG_19FT_COMBO_42_6]|nr:MAG: hypothetical protein A2Z52_00540 [Candidatus Moranbacteria bacterium RBG_19FT_COMBO_42_6]
MKKWIKKLQLYGISKNDFDNEKKILSNKFGKEIKDEDVIWNFFIKITLKTTDLQELKGLYYDKALFLNEEGKNCLVQLQQSAKCELMYLKQQGFVDKVKIFAAQDSCAECKKMDGKTFNINDALKIMPIPCKKCSYDLLGKGKGFCRCCYVAEFD